MANIQVKKEEQPTRPSGRWDWEPTRMMRQFFGWDPFEEMSPLARTDYSTFSPAFEVKETKEGYLFKADVPGVKDNDIDVTVSGNRLSVTGKRDAEKQERSDTYFTYERSFGTFSRSFTLPRDVDPTGINAELKDGVLTIQLQRKSELQPTKIPIRSSVTAK